MLDRLALASVISFLVGIGCASIGVVGWSTLGFIALLSGVFLVAATLKRRRAYVLLTLVLMFLTLGAARTLLAPVSIPGAFASYLNTSISTTGVIVADPDMRDTTQRITVEIREERSTTKIIAVVDRHQSFSYGDIVVVEGRLEAPEPFDTDGGRVFDYPMYLAKDGVFGIVPKATLTKTGESGTLLVVIQRALYEVKHTFVGGVEAALPEPHASLAVGLLTGGKQGLGNDILDAFTITGLLPIIVLSGYNVMIIAEAVLAALAFLPGRWSLGVAGATITLFVLGAGSGASATRAGLMAVLGLFARYTGRVTDALRILLFALVVMLIWNPLLLLYDPGFQFSFVATLGLILFSPLLEARLMWMPNAIVRDIVATTLAAQLFVLPLLLYQTGNLSLVSVVANVIVLPFIPLTMLLSCVAGLVGLVVPAIAAVIGVPAYVLLAAIIGVAEHFAALPFAHVILPQFSALLLIPAYAGIALLVGRFRSSPSTDASR